MKFTFSGSVDLPEWFLVVALIIEVVWLWGVIAIARDKTKDPTDRIVWLMIVLVLNVLGLLLYVLFVPRSENDLDRSEAELKRRANQGKL